MSVYQADFLVVIATPFQGCDFADGALSVTIARPREVSESLASSVLGMTAFLSSMDASVVASVGSEEYSVS